MEKNKIKFIMPKHALTYKDIELEGCPIAENYYGNKMPWRLLREAHFRLNLPFKSIWYNKENRNWEGAIYLYEGLVIPDYVDWLYENNPKAQIVLIYENLSSSYNRPDKFNREHCIMWTSDKNEAEKYNINFNSGGGYFRHWKVTKETPTMDVFYIGKDKNRMETLNMVREKCEQYGLKTFFYVTPNRSYEKCDKDHKPFIPYSEVLKYLGKTRAILHISQGCQIGITMRIEESLIHKIKLITDDVSLVNYDFYDPNNIFIIGMDDWDRLPDFINSDYVEKESKFFEHAFFGDGSDEILNGKK